MRGILGQAQASGWPPKKEEEERFMFVVYQVHISISISMTMLCTYYALFIFMMREVLGLLVLLHFVCWGWLCFYITVVTVGR